MMNGSKRIEKMEELQMELECANECLNHCVDSVEFASWQRTIETLEDELENC